MSDSDVSKEVARLRHLLLKMAELAEHVEQTGSFESGLQNSITRYNTIVQRLEQIGACPVGLFPTIASDSSTGTLGAEATLLAEFLEDIAEEKKPPAGIADVGTIVSLAPFLGREELSSMVRSQFPGARERRRWRHGEPCDNEDAVEERKKYPDIKDIVGLAPHLKSEDLGELLQAYVAREKSLDPKSILQLAPHLNSKDLGALVRSTMPDWFNSEDPPAGQSGPPAQEQSVSSTPAVASFAVPGSSAPVQPAAMSAPRPANERDVESVRLAHINEEREEEA